MSDERTGLTATTDRQHRHPTDDSSDLASSVTTAVARWASNGTLAVAAGVVLSVRALRSIARGRGRALPTLVAGAGALAVGLRQRRSGGQPEYDVGIPAPDDARDASESGGRDRSVDAEVDRGPSDRTDRDPRVDRTDETVEIDVSDPAIADEPGEAVGPDPEQAEPTRTESTEPERDPSEPSEPTGRALEEDEDDRDIASPGSFGEYDSDEPEADRDRFGRDETDDGSEPTTDDESSSPDDDAMFRQDETDLEPSDEEE